MFVWGEFHALQLLLSIVRLIWRVEDYPVEKSHECGVDLGRDTQH